MQITDPVLVEPQAVIPAGTFAPGKVDRLTQARRTEFWMQAVSLAFPDGSVVNSSGAVEIKDGEGAAWMDPS